MVTATAIDVGAGVVIECRSRDVLAPFSAEDTAALSHCVAASLGPVDGVSVSEATADVLRGPEQTIDVEIRVEPTAGAPNGG